MPWWESGAFWGIAGIVAGFIISTAYYCIGKEKFSMQYRKFTMLTTPEEIVYMSKIGFLSNDQLKNISKTTIKFTNSGNRTIAPSDYATKEPLGVHISGHLHQHHVSADNNNSLPTITPMEDNKYKIEFDFLKPKQSFSIALFHDGIVTVFGELRSGKTIGIDAFRPIVLYKMRFLSPYLSLILSAIRILIYIVTIYFVFTVKPLLFAVVGVVLGILTGNILFSSKAFDELLNKFKHKGGGV